MARLTGILKGLVVFMGLVWLVLVIVPTRESSPVASTLQPHSASEGSSKPWAPVREWDTLPKWVYNTAQDQMSGKSEYHAQVISSNTIELDFPYQRPQHGTITLRKHPRYGSDVIFSIERGQLLCTSYQDCSVLIRFDDEEPQTFSAASPADNSTETIFIRNYQRFYTKLQKAKRIRIQPEIYQAGTQVFEFDVHGFKPELYLPKVAPGPKNSSQL